MNDDSSIENLTNNTNFFLFSIVGCGAGSHDENFLSIAEGLQCLRDTGSIAVFASTVLQSWLPPMYQQRELVDIIIDNINSGTVKTIGELFDESVNGTNVFRNHTDYNFYHLFGDPSTRYILTIPELYL